MITLVAQIAPQRSTQYADLAATLAPHEIVLSPLGEYLVGDLVPLVLGGQSYLRFTLDTDLNTDVRSALGALAMTSAYFIYYDELADVDGPLLRPVDASLRAVLPAELVATRRYRGKTNELFTQFMCNVARHSSDYATTAWDKLTLLDPLAGGGTTLFVGLMLGADVVGVEKNQQVVEGTVAFLKQYAKESRISAKFREDRLKSIGKRWFVTLPQSTRCVIGRGDTVDVEYFTNGLKPPQLLVTDLPYNIQHRGELRDMLVDALPAWTAVLADGGAMAFSWDATRFPRAEMVILVQELSGLTVYDAPPYDQLAHRVDRVIKRRDVLIARK